MYERAPWYEIAGGISFFLLLTAITYAVLFLNLCGMIVLLDGIMGEDVQGLILDLCERYEAESIIVTVLGYVIWTIFLFCKLSITFYSVRKNDNGTNVPGAELDF